MHFAKMMTFFVNLSWNGVKVLPRLSVNEDKQTLKFLGSIAFVLCTSASAKLGGYSVHSLKVMGV